MKIFIYALIDPIEQNDFHIYIGQSKNPHRRYYSHLKDSANTHKTHWIRSLLSKNLKPTLQILEECSDQAWIQKERDWISFYKKCKYKIVNGTDGGDGISGYNHSDETKQILRKLRIGTKLSEETKRKIGLSGLGRIHSYGAKKKISDHNGAKSPESKLKISHALSGRTISDEWRRKLSLANLGKKQSDKVRRKISESMKGRFFSENHNRKISESRKSKHHSLPWSGSHRSEETKVRMRHQHKKGWKLSEEHKKKISLSSSGSSNGMFGRHHSEETKRKIGERNRKKVLVCHF